MKAILRIPVRLCPDRGGSAISRQQSDSSRFTRFIGKLIPKTYYLIPKKELSAVSSQLSDSSRFTRFIGKLIPKTYHLIPKKELSAVSIQLSASSCFTRFIGNLRPKTYNLIPILLLVFVSCSAALAQEPVVQTAPAAQAETEITPLKVGDKIPDELWEMYFPVISANSDEVQYLSLGDFKDKLIILDFWATWCSPCVAMIPKMDSLQKVFGDKMQFLSVTYQKKGEVLPFLAKLEQVKEQKFHLPVLTDDEYLRFVFPHNQLPHYVWVENGVIKSITGYEEVNEDNIHTLIKREESNLKAKVDEERIPYDRNKLLFVDGNGGNGEAIRYNSVLAGYTPGLGAGYSIRVDSNGGKKISVTNSPLCDLYSTAFGGRELKYRNQNRIIFEVDNTEKLTTTDNAGYKSWIRRNGYSYEIKVPLELSALLYKMMQDDLSRLFPQYEAQVEKRITECMILVRTSRKDKLRSTSDSARYEASSFGYSISKGDLQAFVNHLNIFTLQNSSYPLINETGYTENVDIEINANLSNIESLNEALKKYDLQLIRGKREIDMLVIRDKYIEK